MDKFWHKDNNEFLVKFFENGIKTIYQIYEAEMQTLSLQNNENILTIN